MSVFSLVTEQKQNTFNTIVFDFGGVLVRNTVFDKLPEMMKKIPKDKLETTGKAYYTFIHCHEEEIDPKKLKKEFKESLHPDLRQYADEIFELNVTSKELFPYSIELIKSLKKKGYKLYYLSNAAAINYGVYLNKEIVKMMQLFDGGIFSYEVKCQKPDKKIYNLLIKRYNLNPKDCIFFDDKQKNCAGAINAGFGGAVVFDSKSTYKMLLDYPKVSSVVKEASEDKCYGIPDQKKFPLPDEKHVLSAIKFFNYVDEEHEKQLASNIRKKIKEYDMADKVHVGDNNRFKKYWNESVIEESVELDAEVMKVYQYPLPSVMPYFTPDEMENMGVFSEDAEKNYYGVKTKNPYAKEWFDTYKATGDPGDNYLQKLLPVIDKKMKEPSYEHKQELLEWGWNPEIAFSEKVKPRMEQVREKILEQYGVTLVSLVEDAVDDPFKLAAVNIAKMLRENKDIIIANRAMKVTDNCNFTIYTILDELKYSSKIHDGIIIGQIHYDSDIVKSDILSVAKAAIERTNEYLASKSQMYMIKDLIYDPDIAPENKQDIIFIKREMAGQTNIAESAKGGRTIEDDTPEVIDLTNKDQLDYNERDMLDSLNDMNDDIDNGISTIEGDKSTSDSNNELSND